MAALALIDLQAALDDHRHLGFGYATREYLPRSRREPLDRAVVAVANESGLDAEDLFLWANSKNGRWLCDAASGRRPTRALVRGFLSREIVEDLKERV